MEKIDDLSFNQAEFLKGQAEKIKKEFNVDIAVSEGRTKKMHFELVYDNKRLFFLNNQIEEETVDGTHYFDLRGILVTDKAKYRSQTLKKNDKHWYHNNEIYSTQINEILNINSQTDKLEFELFLKEYVVDFLSNKQQNVETKFLREIKKTEKFGKS